MPKRHATTHIDAPALAAAFKARELTRRELLRGALAVAATAGPLGVLGVVHAEPKPLVGAGQGRSVEAALDLALAEVGGLSFVGQGDTIYLKVNCNSGDRYPHSTQPAMIEAVVARCRAEGAKRVIVGDRSFFGDRGTLRNLHEAGIGEAAKRAGAELVAFEDEAVGWVHVPASRASDWVGGFRLPAPVMEADHIINLPCVKTHFIAGFTMSLKNLLGLVHATDRAKDGNLATHDTDSGKLWRQIAQVNAALTPSLNILDGFTALVAGGPNKNARSRYAEPKVVIASRDRVACDLTGVALLQGLCSKSEAVARVSAWAHPQIKAAVRAKVGLASRAGYSLSGASVEGLEAMRRRAVA